MMRSRLIAIVLTVGLAAPLTGIAQSYLTPEDVLQQNDGAFLIPSRARGAAFQASLQEQQSFDRHPSIIHQPGDPVQDDGLPPPIAQEEDFINTQPEVFETIPQTNPYGNLDPVTARLLARLEQQNVLLQSQFANNGEPLAQTGPAAILSVMAMLGATLWTLRRARGLEKFVKGF